MPKPMNLFSHARFGCCIFFTLCRTITRLQDAGCYVPDRRLRYTIFHSIRRHGSNVEVYNDVSIFENWQWLCSSPVAVNYTAEPYLCRGGGGSGETVVPTHHSALYRSLQLHSVCFLGSSASLASIIIFCMTSGIAPCRPVRSK